MEKRDASFCCLPSGRETIFTPGSEARGSDSEDPDSPPEVHQEEMCSFLFRSYGGSRIQKGSTLEDGDADAEGKPADLWES